jgi:hypothetical protein
VNVRIPEHLIAFLTHSIQSGELGLVIDTHAAQADEASLVQVFGTRFLQDHDNENDSKQESCGNDRSHGFTADKDDFLLISDLMSTGSDAV